MASLPSPTQVAGPHYAIYDAYYNQIDPNNKGTIEPLDAARFLKKSKLSDIVLGKIWDLSDPNTRGFLNKQGFFVALKLCALAQSGRGISMDNILAADVPQPKMGDIPKMPPNKTNVSTAGIDWSIKPTEKAKYDQLFDSLQPSNGVIPGKKVRGVLMESKLPLDILGKIWDLADIDKDGSLSRHEFMIAMHLVYKALEKHAIPNTLPPELLQATHRKPSLQSTSELIMPVSQPPIPPQPVVPPQPSRPPLPAQSLYNTTPAVITQQPTVNSFSVPAAVAPSVPPPPSIQWVVTPDEKMKYDALFARTDLDHDGFVSGPEIKDVFLQSGVPQADLAVIWGLCDTSQSGKLNNEQFALAMWMIHRKVNGIDPPSALTPDMIPPCLRSQTEVVKENTNAVPHLTPELELLATDIRQLSKERTALENDIAQKEAELKLKDNEVRSLQSELDTLAATLRQLDSQKGEAQKRLNDLKTQKSAIELELSEILITVEAEQAVVDKLRYQADEQEESLRSQENELSSKKQELESLKQEEERLEKQQQENKLALENLSQKLQDSQLQISQVKAKVTQLEEMQRQMNDAVTTCDSALASGDSTIVPDTALSIGPDHREDQINRLAADPEPEPVAFATANFNGDASFDADFPSDAFSNQNYFENADPFGSSAFGPEKPAEGPADPFNAFGAPAAKSDPFEPFGGDSSRAKTPADAAEKDPFGCDPFANLHAPERPTGPSRPESPSPALPPKKAKQPPPRPAPPRPAAPNLRAAPVPPTPSPEPSSVDPFANSSGFDNFANFDGKFNNSAAKTPTVGLRPTATAVTSSSSSATPSPVTAPKNRYESFEFTEDPFKNYRYEDLFNIADPFADTSEPSSDPFGTDSSSADAFEARFPKTESFDVNFPSDDLFGGDFAKADFVNGNQKDVSANIFNGKEKFSDSNANSLMKKTLNIDPFVAQSTKKPEKPDIFINNEGFFDKKKDEKNSSKSGVISDDLQLAWAAQESLRVEEERRKREDQEKADLEYAIALSKKDSGEKRTLRNILRLGRNTPTS